MNTTHHDPQVARDLCRREGTSGALCFYAVMLERHVTNAAAEARSGDRHTARVSVALAQEAAADVAVCLATFDARLSESN